MQILHKNAKFFSFPNFSCNWNISAYAGYGILRSSFEDWDASSIVWTFYFQNLLLNKIGNTKGYDSSHINIEY